MRRIVLRPAEHSPEPPPAPQNHRDRTASQAAFPFGHRGPCRQLHAEVAPRVEYSLTELGYSLKPILDAMWNWGEDYKSKQQ